MKTAHVEWSSCSFWRDLTETVQMYKRRRVQTPQSLAQRFSREVPKTFHLETESRSVVEHLFINSVRNVSQANNIHLQVRFVSFTFDPEDSKTRVLLSGGGAAFVFAVMKSVSQL